jgi:hypothetical protein
MNSTAHRLHRSPLAESVRAAARAGGALLLLALLAGCSSTLEKLPASIGGLPADAPERAATPGAFPAVHDMPPPRNNAVLSEDEQKKAAAELVAARDRQAKRAPPKDQSSNDQSSKDQ